MRLLIALGLVLLAFGHARARRMPVDIEPYEEPCASGKTWPAVKTCLDKLGKVTVLYQTDGVVVVKIKRSESDDASLHLYGKKPDGWYRSNLYGSTNASAEVLSITPFAVPGGNAVRVDVGTVTHSGASLDQATTTPSVWRHVMTNVCMPGTWNCTSMMTRCEIYVAGKVYWSFRGDVVWHPTLGIRIRGNPASAGTMCQPPASLLLDEDR